MAKNKSYRKLVAGSMTAAMVASVVAPATSLAAPKFEDLKGFEWAAGDINALAAKGIVKGYSDTQFAPADHVTRGQVAAYIARAKGFDASKNTEAPSFADAKGHQFAKEIAFVEKLGAIKGDDKGNFNPDHTVTRDEMAKMIVVAYGFKLDADNKKDFADKATFQSWAVEYIDILASLNIVNGTGGNNFDAKGKVQRAQAAAFINRSENYKPVVKEAKVESVTAVNAKTVEVKFTQPVKKSTVVDGTGKLVTTNVEFKTLETPAKAITGTDATATLSEDGKTLTVIAGPTEIFEGRYQVVIKDVETTKSEKLEKYDQVINLGKDTVAPAIASVEKINASTSKVTFTEAITNLAISNEVAYSYKLADGTVVPATDVTVTPEADGKTITVTASAAKYAGKTITVTIVGAVDAAGNLLSPNPSTFSIQVGDKDGVAPTVTSVKSLAGDKVEVVFTEEVQGFATGDAVTAAANFTLTGGTVASVTATKIEQDSTDKKKYVVTLSGSAITSPATSALGDAKVVKTNITDLSGEPMKDDYNSIVTVTTDTTAPTLVSSSVVTEAGAKYLELVFSEEIDTTTLAVSGQAASYKDYVTSTGTLVLGAVTNGSSDKVVRVALVDTTFGGNALVAGAKYDFRITAKDANGVTTKESIAVSFTNEAVASTNKPVITNQAANVIATTNVTNNTIELVFDRELDGATATNAANYTIAGVKVKSATLAAVTNGTQTVTLTLDTNELTGNRAIKVANVKSKAGVVMDTFSGLVALKENVKPEVKSAKVTGTTTIEVTFSEAIQSGLATNDDFVLKVGSTPVDVAKYNVVAVSGDATKATITLTDALTTANLAEAITLETLVGMDAIVDAAGNTVKVGTVTVSK